MTQAEQWGYVKAKKMLKGKTITFCHPRSGGSYTYLNNLARLYFELAEMGASIQNSDYSSEDLKLVE